jgi:hypothetical protein
MMNDDMQDKDEPTVEQTLAVLSEALGKASADLFAVRSAIDLARVDMSSHNGSHTRDVIRHAERVVDQLRKTDESLSEVLDDLRDTD